MGCREIKVGRLRTRILCSFYKETITFVSLTHHLGGLVAKSCPTLCDPVNCSTPGFPVLHYLSDFAHSWLLSQRYQPTISSSVAPFSSCPQPFPASGFFPMSQLFTSGAPGSSQNLHSVILSPSPPGLTLLPSSFDLARKKISPGHPWDEGQ